MKIGDVLELATPGGRAYLHVTHRHKVNSGFSYGWYCRVLRGRFKRRPGSDALAKLCADKERFGCFVRGVERLPVVAKIAIPANAAEFPLFKLPIRLNAQPGCTWTLWDGRDVRVAYLLPEEAVDLPLKESIDLTILTERIEADWTPAVDVPPECIAGAAKPFSFSNYPPASDFWAHQDEFGDIIGFLRHHGLVEQDDSTEGIEVAGVGLFDNSAAETWLQDLAPVRNWCEIERELDEFASNPIRDAVPSAIALAAVGCVLVRARRLECAVAGVADSLCKLDVPPRPLISASIGVVSQIQLRSGLRTVMTQMGLLTDWLNHLEEVQLQLTELQSGRWHW